MMWFALAFSIGSRPDLRVNEERVLIGRLPFTGLLLDWDSREVTLATYLWGHLHGAQARISRATGRLTSWRTYAWGKKEGIHRGWHSSGGRRFLYEFHGGLHHGAALE